MVNQLKTPLATPPDSESPRFGIRHGSDHIAQELGGEHPACFQLQFHKGELAGPVDGQEQA